MHNTQELTNLEMPIECCTLEAETGKLTFYKGNKKTQDFTGLYFKDDNSFFAIYPSVNGPLIFFNGKEFAINKNLSITLSKQDKIRIFKINDYGIEIHYLKSPYIGFDSWSDEIDVDLFCMIEQKYKEQSFYERYTCK